MSIGIFTLPLAANEVREADITGEYFELRNALSPVVLIELLDRSGGVIARLDNPEQSDFVRPGRYEKVRITNGATAQTVKHFYGTGDAGSRRTSGLVQVEGTVSTVGTVQVVDGGKARTLANQAFAWANGRGAVAAEYSLCQMYNPAGSGKRVILKAYEVIVPAAATVAVFTQAAALATALAAVVNSKFPSSAISPVCLSKSGGAAALSIDPKYINYMRFAAAGTAVRVLQEPIVLDPGQGLVIESQVLNQGVNGSYEWTEESI